MSERVPVRDAARNPPVQARATQPGPATASTASTTPLATARMAALQHVAGNVAVAGLVRRMLASGVVQRCGAEVHEGCACAEKAGPVQRAYAAPAFPRILRSAPAVLVQRKTYSSDTVKTLLQDTAQAEVPGKIIGDHGDWLSKATDDERVDLLNACFVAGSAAVAIDLIWFRCANWEALARKNPTIWTRSLDQMSQQTFVDAGFFSNLLDTFLFDTEEVARGYLDINQKYCETSLDAMFYDHDGKPLYRSAYCRPAEGT